MPAARTLEPRIRCAVHTRQSVKAEPGEALTSCEAQREHTAMFIESQRYEDSERVRQRLDDVGEAGASLERTALQRLMEACVAGQVNRVVVWKLDRVTRSGQNWTKLAEFFEQTGAEVTLAGQALDRAGLTVIHFVQHVLASFTEYARALIGEPLRDARAARRAARHIPTMVPLGVPRALVWQVVEHA